MLLEGLVTSISLSDEINLAPMGPIVNADLTQLTLRPFQTSTTFRNLKERPYGVFHITDDVLLIAKAALYKQSALPETFAATSIHGRVLADCCRWYEFEITECDDSAERTRLEAKVLHCGRIRDFIGFHRARHAVIEATILATRLHLIPEVEVRSQLKALGVLVEKTAGHNEAEAFQLVCNYVEEWNRSR